MAIKLSNLTQTFAKVGQEQTKNRPRAAENESATVDRSASAAEVALARPKVESAAGGPHKESRFVDVEQASRGAQELANQLRDDAGVAVLASAGRLSKNVAGLLSGA